MSRTVVIETMLRVDKKLSTIFFMIPQMSRIDAKEGKERSVGDVVIV